MKFKRVQSELCHLPILTMFPKNFKLLVLKNKNCLLKMKKHAFFKKTPFGTVKV